MGILSRIGRCFQKPKIEPPTPYKTDKFIAAQLTPCTVGPDLYYQWMLTIPQMDRDHLRVFADKDEHLIDDYEKRFDWPGFRDSELAMQAAAMDYDAPVTISANVLRTIEVLNLRV